MHDFQYRGGVLHAENVPLPDIAETVGTPVYIYSASTLLRHVDVFRAAFATRKIGLFFAVKANGNLAVLHLFGKAGIGADVVSQGELRKSLKAGIPASRIIYSGVGKTDDDLGYAVDQTIFQINVETEDELHRLAEIAHAKGKTMPVALRVNPAVGAGGHAKITTGLESSKFGVSFGDAERLYKQAATLQGVTPVGLAVHIGSQIHDLAPLREAFVRLRGLAEKLVAQGHEVKRLDLGGGLGVFYDAAQMRSDDHKRVDAYAKMVNDVMDGCDAELSFEPGRLIAANAGVLLTKVITHNTRPQKTFLVVDAAMNDLLRPSLYDARHEILPVREGEAAMSYDVVGPVCESTDSFGDGYALPAQQRGDLLALLSGGAYGAAMASNYNQRPLIAEVLVQGDTFAVVRERQSYDALLNTDSIPDWL